MSPKPMSWLPEATRVMDSAGASAGSTVTSTPWDLKEPLSTATTNGATGPSILPSSVNLIAVCAPAGPPGHQNAAPQRGVVAGEVGGAKRVSGRGGGRPGHGILLM